MSADCYRSSPGLLSLTLHIQPGAKKTEIAGLHGDALKIRLAAPPVDGKANSALLAFIAGQLDLPRARVSLKSGLTSRRKVVEITDPPSDAAARLGLPAAP